MVDSWQCFNVHAQCDVQHTHTSRIIYRCVNMRNICTMATFLLATEEMETVEPTERITNEAGPEEAEARGAAETPSTG